MAFPDKRLESTWWALRIAYGAVPIVAGADKFTNLLTDWKAYLNPGIARFLPVDAGTFMGAVGVVEIVVGLAVLTRFTRAGAYLAAAWLAAIALTLVASGRFLDVAVRDLMMALGSYTLARLTEARAAVPARDRAPLEDPLRRSPVPA